MTHPLTPRENLTRPIVGIENRTAHEVFDIMSDRFRAHLTALASGSGDHAELIERVREVAGDCLDAKDGGIILGGTVAREHGADLEALLAQIEALRAKAGLADVLGEKLERRTFALDEAERKLAESDGLLIELAAAPQPKDTGGRLFRAMSSINAYVARMNARTFLSKEAEQ